MHGRVFGEYVVFDVCFPKAKEGMVEGYCHR